MTLTRTKEYPFPQGIETVEDVQKYLRLLYVALIEDRQTGLSDLNQTDIDTIGSFTLRGGGILLDTGDVTLTAGNLSVGGTLTVNSVSYTWPVADAAGHLASNGSGTLSWSTTAPSHNILHAVHADTVAASAVAGDIMYANATPKWTKLAKGTDTHVLTLSSGLPVWSAAAGGGTESSISKLSTTASVDCSSTATTTLYTVPAGKKCIVTHIMVRNPSTDAQVVWFEVGFDVQDGVVSIEENAWSSPGNNMFPAAAGEVTVTQAGGYTRNIEGTPVVVKLEIGDASDTLVFKCVNGVASLTATVDVFGYTY